MRQSESIAKLAAALVKAQAEVENATKNRANTHLNTMYADLGEVLRVVKPVLASNGLAVVQLPGIEGDAVTLETVLVHESGEWLSGVSGAPLPVGRVNKKGEPVPVTAQDVGSAVSYLRRYSLAAVAAITQEDDDGQGVGQSGPQYLSEFQARDIRERIKDTASDEKRFLAYMKAESVEKIPADAYNRAVAALNAKVNGKNVMAAGAK